MSEYPRDDFDDLDVDAAGRRGVHRARPSPAWAVVPLLLVALAVVAVAVAAISMVGGDGEVGAAEPPAGAATGTQPPTAAATEPPTAAPEPTASPTSEPPPPDRSAAVTVLNGTRTGGLAGDVAERLTDAGWDDVTTGNYREDETPPTTVFHAGDGDRAAAESAAADLGDLPVAQDAEIAEDGVVVLLGEDYAG